MLRSQFEEDLEKLHNQFYTLLDKKCSHKYRTVHVLLSRMTVTWQKRFEDDAEK